MDQLEAHVVERTLPPPLPLYIKENCLLNIVRSVK